MLHGVRVYVRDPLGASRRTRSQNDWQWTGQTSVDGPGDGPDCGRADLLALGSAIWCPHESGDDADVLLAWQGCPVGRRVLRDRTICWRRYGSRVGRALSA